MSIYILNFDYPPDSHVGDLNKGHSVLALTEMVNTAPEKIQFRKYWSMSAASFSQIINLSK